VTIREPGLCLGENDPLRHLSRRLTLPDG
jgi:hypothetical protein